MLQFENHNKVLEKTRKYLFDVLKWNKAKWELEIYQKRYNTDALVEFSFEFPISKIVMNVRDHNSHPMTLVEALFKYDNEILKFTTIEVPEIEGAKWDITTTKL